MLTIARGSKVGWGIRLLQAERSRARFPVRPLDFSVYAILPAALLALWSTAFDRYEYQESSWG
jgi:hypothetical protein